MHRELLILRHGHAHDFNPDGDFDRELTDKGKRNAQRIGIWLAQHELRPDHTVSSTATRARRTAEKCTKTAGLSGGDVHLDRRIYEANVPALLAVLAEVPTANRRVMLVGHNPSLGQLVHSLARDAGPTEDPFYHLHPATLVHLRVDGEITDLTRGCADVVNRVHAKSLPRRFPFPGLGGQEQRGRPAYYYRQSSVVPFREQDGRLEVLIVSSSKRKHWVIPKGIHDPGMSAQDSAAKEALEEAGIEGVVLDQRIGTYTYPKWDATCEVSVYPMEVTRVLPESEWQESHRGRKWLPVDEAVETLFNQDVKRLVAALPLVLARPT